MPHFFLKTLQKYESEEKPLCAAHSESERSVYCMSSLAYAMRRDRIYCKGVVLKIDLNKVLK